MPADIKKIYLTHCSAKKNSVLKSKKAKVTPDKLYTPLVILFTFEMRGQGNYGRIDDISPRFDSSTAIVSSAPKLYISSINDR